MVLSSQRFVTGGFLKRLAPHGDEDFIDRLNYYYTPTLFLLAAALVSGKQYFAKPIQCFIPPQFTRSMEEYIESYCWIQNTYWLPAHENIPDDYESRERRQIGYYQWVPFILLLQAFLFTLPCVLWRLTNRRSGLDLNQLVNASQDARSICDRSEKSRLFSSISDCLGDSLQLQSDFSNRERPNRKFDQSINRFWWSWSKMRKSGYYLTISYLITKFLYAVNGVGQFFLLNAFLESDSYQLYGFRVLIDLLAGREWTQSGHFPRVTLCDFEVRTVGNLNRYTVQCALAANLFNEKIFVFVWVWLCVAASITSTSFFLWFFAVAFRSERAAFVIENLLTSGRGFASDKVSLFDQFLDRYLKVDGILALRIISVHAGDAATGEITRGLWRGYKNRLEVSDGIVVVSNSDIDECCRVINITKETFLIDSASGSPSNQ